MVGLLGEIGVVCADDRSTINEQHVGSNLKRRSFESDLPIYKSYAELSTEEKARVKDAYESMPEADEPPYPEYGLQQIWVPINKLADALSKNGVALRGPFTATVRVDGTGKGRSISIFETPDPDFNKPAAIILLKKATYKPARCGGQPCVMDFPVHINFVAGPLD
ncbi:MAG: hypothetical protein E6R07_01930 [Nevskiaceae bacterium]|nr:MAG: hypothetical protein E6R07_01930 [Nevskiaceae bacterium]